MHSPSLILTLALAATSAHAELRLASWNLNNLHYVENEPLRVAAPPRSADDFAVLRKYADQLEADIVALQEVNGPRAAARVFSADDYRFFFSGRYTRDITSNRPTDYIYTGFAVRREVFDSVKVRDYEPLGLATLDGRRVRWGVELIVERNGQRLAMLNVHLKSGCFARNLETPTTSACDTLARQREPLERWIDERYADGMEFVVLGDFNRAFDVHGPRDHLWGEINDGEPSGLRLWRLPYDREPECWRGTASHYDHPIDFFVFGPRAWKRVERESFAEIVFSAGDADPVAGTPSDHCPIAVTLDF